MPNSMNQSKEQLWIENSIRNLITKFRTDLKLPTKFDPQLEHILVPALYNYEQDKLCQMTCGAQEFQAAIKNHLPENSSFKAFPI
jgi:hypothetical protein